jgi:UDP-N-acetylglucosamine--N-acetylmuramyl-(pentapeptide) pyrophosphoryl-undecaprenol N-acetylglucosamine transferase
LWLSGKSIEKKTIQDWAGPVSVIPTDWENTSSPLAFIRSCFSLTRSWFHCLRLLREAKPDALLAMGSRASIIPVAATRTLRIPVVLHESNVMPGKAVQFLAKHFTCTVAVGFAESIARLPGQQPVLTGFPLRDMTPRGPLPGLPPGPAPAVLVMGGSQGATRVNDFACDTLIRLHREGVPLRVIHLAGTKQEEAIRKAYSDAGVPNVVFGFLQDMGAAYSNAAVAVSRAGAASCAELAAFGVPAFYIPYPFAGNHQRLNALAMEKAGAAITRSQDSLTVEGMAERLGQLLKNPVELAAMRLAALKAATPDAGKKLAALLVESGSGKKP